MKRTASRPVPAGRMERRTALQFGVWTSGLSVGLMELAANRLAATLVAVAIGCYVLIHTVWLKRQTPQNIVIGGAAGAFPPLIGWVAAAGAVLPWPLGLARAFYGWTATMLSVVFLIVSTQVARRTGDDTMREERQLFLYSMAYLLVVFGALALDRLMAA